MHLLFNIKLHHQHKDKNINDNVDFWTYLGHFKGIKGGLEGIKNFPKNMKIANLQVLPGLTLLQKIRQF